MLLFISEEHNKTQENKTDFVHSANITLFYVQHAIIFLFFLTIDNVDENPCWMGVTGNATIEKKNNKKNNSGNGEQQILDTI